MPHDVPGRLAAAPRARPLAAGRCARPFGPRLTERTRRAIGDHLAGRGRGLRGVLLFAGPAVVASTAYMDPGNVAVNITAGAGYGYGLLWVVLLANLVAMLFQALAARLGIASGRNLAELCRERYSAPLAGAMWIAAELAAIATDLAELLGGAIGFALLLQLPLLGGMALTALAAGAILVMDNAGFRGTEIVIGALVVVIGACYVVELAIVPVDWRGAAIGLALPSLPDLPAAALAAGIFGATVMPHALYLHSGLTQHRAPMRSAGERRRLAAFSDREVIVALAIAGAVNLAMVVLAAATLRGAGSAATIGSAYRMLGPLFGPAAAAVFLISLITSGISSSAVGTMAGQIVMQGFVGFRIPLWLRRLVTMLPAFAVIASGVEPTRALVLSQIVLSLALPLPMIPLLLFSRRRDIMGSLAVRGAMAAAALAAAVLVLGINFVLLTRMVA